MKLTIDPSAIEFVLEAAYGKHKMNKPVADMIRKSLAASRKEGCLGTLEDRAEVSRCIMCDRPLDINIASPLNASGFCSICADWWHTVDVQRPDGSWTTVGELLNNEKSDA